MIKQDNQKWGKGFSNLTDLYELFQFKKIEQTENFVVYQYNNGYFHIVEIFIVSLSDKNISDLKHKYEEVGFMVKIVKYSDLCEAHDKLYKGFFDLDKTIGRIRRNYNQYCLQQTEQLTKFNDQSHYEYISGHYYKDGFQGSMTNLVESVGNDLLDSETKLIILEAAAGMGKTSTAYEILNYISSHRSNLIIPLLIELTKNRGARIFRHVLDDEIDKNFPGLQRDLIVKEIRNGNILLIIDGFDELLSQQKGKTDSEDDSGNAQTMLDTIAELLQADSKARIVLTSRKSTIFVGEQFDAWKDETLKGISVCRYQIAHPTIQDWLGYNKVDILKSKGITLESINNPVLLNVLRNTSEDEICNIESGKSIIDLYFDKLLERERTRQDLILSIEEQKTIFTHLAKEFVSYEIMSEEGGFIREILLEEILNNNIDEYMDRYIESERRPQDEEEFAMKFVHHALMDRINPFSNKIGFINEFIFGIFIAEAIIRSELSIENSGLLNQRYIIMASEAFAIENADNRKFLYDKSKEIINLLDEKQRLQIELTLLKTTAQNYNGIFFDSIAFQNISILDYGFANCTFFACIFKDCEIKLSLFDNCSFINCQFYDVNIKTDNCIINTLYFVECIGGEELIDKCSKPILDKCETTVDFKKTILENFWKPGKVRAESRRSPSAIFRGTQPQDRMLFSEALDDLLKSEILEISCGYYNLKHDKIAEIRKILGRD